MKKSYGLAISMLMLAALCRPFAADEPEKTSPAWLQNIASSERVSEIKTIQAEAEVKVSDGTSFRTTVVYQDPQHAAFRSEDAERTTSMGVEGERLWAFDGTEEKEAGPFVREFVLGHQFHAQILFFDRLYPNHHEPKQASFEDHSCDFVSIGDEDSLRALYFDPDNRPLGMRTHHGPEMHITITYDDWRELDGLTLPFLVRIDDGNAVFEYHYTDVRLNDGSVGELKP